MKEFGYNPKLGSIYVEDGNDLSVMHKGFHYVQVKYTQNKECKIPAFDDFDDARHAYKLRNQRHAPLQVIKMDEGYCIGRMLDGKPYSRRSVYFKTRKEAIELLNSNKSYNPNYTYNN